MSRFLFTMMYVLALFSACTQKPKASKPQLLNTAGLEAGGPYFTKDNKGNAVLCWTEMDNDSLYRLRYAIYNEQNGQFDSVITVPTSVGCSNSSESMGKIAFKNDGTVLALFAKRFTMERNPYAGAIYYSMSADAGKHWTHAKFLHQDTIPTYGRSFFDIATLKDGELGAIWLDGRFGKTIKGSALFFARTQKGSGFKQESCLDKGTCECCRTDILTDDAGTIHLAYRSIKSPSALADKQVRDMIYRRSLNNGKSFSNPETISNDNWEITGCPHSGPSLASSNNVLCVTWFTAGGGAALYYTTSKTRGEGFNSRRLLSTAGRHPQMLGMKAGKTAVIYEEQSANLVEAPMKGQHKHGGTSMSHTTAGLAKIVLRMIDLNSQEISIDLTDGKMPDNHAVLTSVNGVLLAAWVRQERIGAKIYYAQIR